MLSDPSQLIEEFKHAALRAGIPGPPYRIRHELLAPHEQPGLRPGSTAEYVFSLSDRYGDQVPAGRRRILKVGKVRPNSSARFRSQHYGFSAGSTLAKSIVIYEVLWPWLGIDSLSREAVKPWMLRNLDRDHFYLP